MGKVVVGAQTGRPIQTEALVDLLDETGAQLLTDEPLYAYLLTAAGRDLLLTSERRKGMLQLSIVWEALQTEVPANLLLETGDTTDPIQAERAGFAFVLTATPKSISLGARRI